MLFSSSFCCPSSSESAPGFTVSQISGINTQWLTLISIIERKKYTIPFIFRFLSLFGYKWIIVEGVLKAEIRQLITYCHMILNQRHIKNCCFYSPAISSGKAGVSRTGEMGAGTCETEVVAAGRTGDKG